MFDTILTAYGAVGEGIGGEEDDVMTIQCSIPPFQTDVLC